MFFDNNSDVDDDDKTHNHPVAIISWHPQLKLEVFWTKIYFCHAYLVSSS